MWDLMQCMATLRGYDANYEEESTRDITSRRSPGSQVDGNPVMRFGTSDLTPRPVSARGWVDYNIYIDGVNFSAQKGNFISN